MSKFLNERYRPLTAYTPGEQPRDKKYIKLNTNESPFPPSASVMAALDGQYARSLNLYPDPTCAELRDKLASLFSEKVSLTRDNIFVSNGSDDILNFSFMAFCNGEDSPAAFPNISYGFYRVYAELYGVKYIEIPLKEDFSICPEDYISLGGRYNIVIANPNAPTGLSLSANDIERMVASAPDKVVLIDEAYVDFGGESVIPLIEKYKNLLVVGTYSKSRSMAGARLGFAVGDPELISDLEKIKYSTNPYNVNRMTLAAGMAAIDDNEYYMDGARKIIATRERIKKELYAEGFTLTDSKANFIFAKSNKIGGLELYSELRKRGILVRHFSTPTIEDYNRITVGTDEEMDELMRCIKEILANKCKNQ